MEMRAILDNYSIAGTTESEFKEALEQINTITRDFVVKATDIVFLSYCSIPEHQRPDRLTFYVLSEGNLDDFRVQGTALPLRTIPESRLAPELVRELKERDELLALVDGCLYFVSNLAIPTLMARTGVAGDSTATRATIFRDMHLADAAFSRNENFHIVYREIDKMRKIFACLGGSYKMVPQTILTDIIDNLRTDPAVGQVVVHDWSINNSWTRIYVDFPDMAEDFATMYKLPDTIVPGLLLQTSDIGLCSVTIRSTYRSGKSYVIADEVTQKHTLNAQVEEIKDRVDKEIFTGIRKLPECLMRLLGKYAYGDETLDFSNKALADKNAKATAELYRRITRDVLQPVLAKKHCTPLLEAMVLEINPEAHYTLYDVAMTFMGLADRLTGVSKITRDKLRKACADVPFVLESYVCTSSKHLTDIEDITLLPE